MYYFKSPVFLLSTICCLQSIAQIKQQPVASKIEKVIVYTNGAQVLRKANSTLTSGKTLLTFAGISPNIDKQSIQVKGDGKFTILSVVHQINFLNEQSKREEISKLEQQKFLWQQKMVVEKNMLLVIKNEIDILEKNKAIGGNNVGVKTSDLKEAVDFQKSRLTEVLAKQIEVDNSIRRIDSASQKINLQLRALMQTQNNNTSEILVTVQANALTTAAFEVQYYVKKAGWYANYDINVKDISSPIDIAFKANVFQQSGEDWNDVKLSISNGNPSENGVAPKLQPWYIYFGNAKSSALVQKISEVAGKVIDAKDGSPIPGATVMIKGSRVGTNTDVNGAFALKLTDNATTLQVNTVGYDVKEMPVNGINMVIPLQQSTQNLQEVVVTGYSAQGDGGGDGYSRSQSTIKKERILTKPISSIELQTNISYQPTTINYDIEMPYTILNDGKTYAVQIKNMATPALFEYIAIPRFEKDAFLHAKITDWQDLNLIEGEANLFFEGAYLGKTILDIANASDTLTISLGRDKAIAVERKKMKEFTNKQFLSNYKTDNRAYEIIVHNNKQQAINIIVLDQLPISTTKEITVDEQETTSAKVDADTKICTWNYTIQAKQQQKIVLKYGVKYPKNQILVLE